MPRPALASRSMSSDGLPHLRIGGQHVETVVIGVGHDFHHSFVRLPAMGHHVAGDVFCCSSDGSDPQRPAVWISQSPFDVNGHVHRIERPRSAILQLRYRACSHPARLGYKSASDSRRSPVSIVLRTAPSTARSCRTGAIGCWTKAVVCVASTSECQTGVGWFGCVSRQ
jgi:hypothetical protein